MTIDNTISFRADMIDMILSGRKTVTIRPMKPQPEQIHVLSENGLFDRMYMQWQGRDLSEKGSGWLYDRYPHGRVGEVMTVRERNDIQLRIIGIRVSRLPDIDRNWWLMDGLTFDIKVIGGEDKSIHHWNSFYGDTEYRWDKNMWVWVIEFKLVRGGSK
jgi:hypothetical protein